MILHVKSHLLSHDILRSSLQESAELSDALPALLNFDKHPLQYSSDHGLYPSIQAVQIEGRIV
jgi:hypothetical protein